MTEKKVESEMETWRKTVENTSKWKVNESHPYYNWGITEERFKRCQNKKKMAEWKMAEEVETKTVNKTKRNTKMADI